MTDRDKNFEAVAREAARRAGDVLRANFRAAAPIDVIAKGRHDFVTEIDRLSESAAVDFLKQSFPDHAVMSEEGSPNERAAAFRWIVDPLDGTTNFIHGVLPFSVSVALEDPRGLVAAAVYDPFHDEMFHAHRGGGAWLNEQPIRCSAVGDRGTALVATGFPFRELSRLDRYLQAFEAVIRSTAGLRRAGSAAIDLAYTACGRYDAFWEIGLSRWDVAAGILLVREAGGVVTDVVGGDTMLDSGDIVAGGRSLHPMLLEITRAAFG